MNPSETAPLLQNHDGEDNSTVTVEMFPEISHHASSQQGESNRPFMELPVTSDSSSEEEEEEDDLPNVNNNVHLLLNEIRQRPIVHRLVAIEWVNSLINRLPLYLFFVLIFVVVYWKPLFVLFIQITVYRWQGHHMPAVNLIAKQLRRKSLLFILFLLLVNTIGYYCLKSWFLEGFGSPQLFPTLLRVIVSDFFLYNTNLVFKLVISLSATDEYSSRRRQMVCLVEHGMYLIRLIASFLIWTQLFIRKYYISSYFYVGYKGGLIVNEFRTILKMVLHACHTSLMFGKYVRLNDGDASCSICMEEMKRPVELSCKHRFCEDCITHWLEKETTCPLCRKTVHKDPSWIHSDGRCIIRVVWF